MRRVMSQAEVVGYWGMRSEFVRDRALLPPHADAPERRKLPKTFDFARYLLEALSEDLVEMVDVTWQTWLVLEALACAWCLAVAVDERPTWLAALWVGFEYFIFFT